ncbi:Decaprenyl-phosphate phosphoribosyltransferase [bacterium HR21]|jgi:4-hydroxybenzoate polyprenyltransferase|nr:Decaprenyl-phosphate phosphoribosyltransferase [bacterium HR21]
MSQSLPPLVVDLDGTLLRTDTLWESFLGLLRRRPWRILWMPFWLLQGRAVLKVRLLAEALPDIEYLPLREEVLQWLQAERCRGRRLILATASPASVGQVLAQRLGLFEAVVGSSDTLNARGKAKLALVRQYLGELPFEYLGNSWADFPVWAGAVEAHVVGTPRFIRRVRRHFPRGRDFPQPLRWSALLGLLRPYQWVKNLLVFLPMLLAHRVLEGALWGKAIAAFAALSLVASGLYVVNDLLDVEADRHHPRKRFRPLARGDVPLWVGMVMAPLVFGMGFGIAGAVLPPLGVLAVGLYGGLSAAYSLWLKTLPLLDVLALAGLYTVRVLAGGWATQVPLSGWLLTFAIFFFLSLAFLKRYVELRALGGAELPRRGYTSQDEALVRTFGIASGYLAVLVFVLYLNSPAVVTLYREPRWLWLSVPLLLYWIAYLWLSAHRGRMPDDPILFVLRDPVSYIVAAGLLGLFVLGSA